MQQGEASFSTLAQEVKTLQEKLKSLKSDKEQTERLLEYAAARLRLAASKEFYLQYGEWDWEVRKRYLELVKSLGCPWPIPDETVGFSCELNNFLPRSSGPSLTPEDLKPGDFFLRGMHFEDCTEFVRAEYSSQLKLSPKTLAAFQLLQYYSEKGKFTGRGFCLDAVAKRWDERDDFDPTGYQFHLQEN